MGESGISESGTREAVMGEPGMRESGTRESGTREAVMQPQLQPLIAHQSRGCITVTILHCIFNSLHNSRNINLGGLQFGESIVIFAANISGNCNLVTC